MAESKRDYYEVLGLSKGASDDEIKKAYRKMAKQYHPDLHPGDAEAEKCFKEVNEAYEVLSDPDKKARYDQYGHAGVDPNMGAGGAGGFGGFSADFGDLGDLFSSFFGGGGSSQARRNGPTRGEDLEAQVTITFEEAVFGCKKEVTYNRIEKCSDCKGSGAAAGSSPETCPQCNGQGQVRVTQQTFMGVMQTTKACPNCRGTGKIIKNPCSNCRGTGMVRLRKKLEVAIPAGIDDGQQIRLTGQGSEGRNGGPAGNLYITVHVRPHAFFERDGINVYCDVPITFTEAALGAEIEVPVLEGGTTQYRIPAGTQTDTRFTLRGKGIRQVNGRGTGDLIFRTVVETPKNLSNEQKELLRKLEESFEGRKKSFFGKKKK
ncbi:MAG: molecular chaperone DnaJ [Clostridia bacterium]|nr:molecular chaperone DnaJ [Clostridia bacterium]